MVADGEDDSGEGRTAVEGEDGREDFGEGWSKGEDDSAGRGW